MDVETHNARWLQAWSDKDVEGLLAFYAPDVVYRDPQVPAGLVGRDALRDAVHGVPPGPEGPTARHSGADRQGLNLSSLRHCGARWRSLLALA